MNFSFRSWALAHLQQAAWWLMGLAVLSLLAGWFSPELWRPAFAERRSLGFVLLGVGALTMWLHARREAERQSLEALSSLTHSTLMPYEFAPVTLPMEEPPEAAAVQPLADTDATSAADSGATNAVASGERSVEGSASPPPTQWSPGVLRALEWHRFEALCEEIFKQDGYVTKSEPRGADGGDYLWLHSRLDLQQAVRIVQCRNWSGEPVGVAAVREFLGAMVDAGLKSGALMSCGTFTAEAEALARRHSIMAVSGPDLMALVAKRPEALQRELLAVATLGDYRRPTCRRCGLKMLAHPSSLSSTASSAVSAANGGPTHWVCEGAPRCQGTLEWSAGPV